MLRFGSCCRRESWFFRFGCVLAAEERADCLGLIVFLLGKRESSLLRFGCVLAGEQRAGCLGLVVFLLGKRELVA